MPQIQPQRSEKTATNVKENKAFRDRLRDRYSPTEFVRVINIDNEPFNWQYFPPDGEEITYSDRGAVQIVSGRAHFDNRYETKLPGNEQMWELGAGDTEVLVGSNADLFIEGLFKRLVTKKRLHGIDVTSTEKRPEINFNFSDGLMQEQMIDKIFMGVVNPNFNEPKREEQKEPARVGRPPKTE